MIEQARQHNPEIQAARHRADAAAAIPDRVSAYDDPMFAYEAFNVPESLRLDRTDNNIFRVSQRVPFPGKRTLAGTVADHDAEAIRQDVAGVELDVVAAVTRAYYDLWLAYQTLDVFEREKALVQRFTHIAEQRYATSEVTQSDVLRSQVELTRVINRVTTERLAIEGARAELNALLSQAPAEPLGVPESPPVPKLAETAEQWTALALKQRPEVAAQTAIIARDDSSVRLAHLNYLPDFEFTVGRFINAGRSDGFGAIASVSIPLAYRAKYAAGVTEANAQLAAAQSDQRKLQDRIKREVTQAFVRARTAMLQRDLFLTTHIPQAEQALRVTESGYQTGAVDFLALIDTARTIEAVHLEHLQAEADFQKAYADLERAAGTPPDGENPR
ncbi:MAG: TolC family protein [Deltaproteobacteria bacterium]|nr:TolC family protein [Deltaproteobacteria bacterium]